MIASWGNSFIKGKYVKRRPHVSNRAMEFAWIMGRNLNWKGKRIK